jgi:hypothetical protein
MSIKQELERRQAEREALEAKDIADRAKRLSKLEEQAGKLVAYQAERAQELGSLGVVTHADRKTMRFDYKHIAVVVTPDLNEFSVYASKINSGEPLAVSLAGSKKIFADPYELDAYLADVIDRVNMGRM